MLVFLIGHRGVGKSTLLRQLVSAFPELWAEDLDEAIAAYTGRGLEEIFQQDGEAAFRKLEARVLLDVLAQSKAQPLRLVALGAGFAERPPGLCLWVRRESDRLGRVTLNRPKLSPSQNELETYQSRFQEREARYEAWADEVLTLREGEKELSDSLRAFFANDLKKVGGTVTVLGSDLKSLSFERRRDWGFDFFEIRTDFLGPVALEKFSPEKVLLSFRPSSLPGWKKADAYIAQGYQVDWDESLGKVPKGTAVLSSHGSEPPHASAAWLKWAPQVDSFLQLRHGHAWQKADPLRRMFFPSSPDGRFTWYRLLQKGRYPLNFLREGKGSSPDQPTLLEWLATPARPQEFAAILGWPILHSYTPVEQEKFFAPWPVLRIPVQESEWDEALPFLVELGLRAAAVTSPLKSLAFQTCRPSARAQKLQSANTLVWKSGRCLGENTDLEGLREALPELSAPVAVWGGGGTRRMLEDLLPKATFHSVRKGGDATTRPQTLVWAARPDAPFPPRTWRPERVLDLNYSENSAGRLYAQALGATYDSGEEMFRRQAALQRLFWKEHGLGQ